MMAVSQFGSAYERNIFSQYMNPPASITDAVGGLAPDFHDVTNVFSREATLLWLRYHIAETFAFVGIYDTSSKRQIMQTAELIVDHEIYGQLNLEEFLVFLKLFKCGEYGKIYQSARPNPQEFLMCLKPFWEDLQAARLNYEQEQQRKRLDDMLHDPDNMTYEEFLEIKTIERMYEMRF